MFKKMFLIVLTILLISPMVGFAAPVLQMSSSVTPATVVPGNEGYISLSITNIGTSANNIKIKSASVSTPLVGKTVFDTSGFGGLEALKSLSTIFRFSVPEGTPSGFYTVTFSVQVCEGSTCTDYGHNALIDVRAPSTLEFGSILPSELKIGEKTDMIFSIINTGSTKLNNIILKWDSSNDYILPLGTGNRITISSIGKNEEKKVSIPVLVSESAKPGISSISVDISYDDSAGIKQTVSSTVGMAITGDIDLITNIEENKLYYGDEGTLTISIVNRGTISAAFMTVKAESDYGDQEFYIGEIEPDDYESVEIKQNLEDLRKGSYPLKLSLKYKDTFNNEHIVEKEFELIPHTMPIEIPIIMIIVVLVAVGGIIWWVRKRKK